MRFTRSETCNYIHSQATELRKLAEAAKLDTAAHLLRMLELETASGVTRVQQERAA